MKANVGLSGLSGLVGSGGGPDPDSDTRSPGDAVSNPLASPAVAWTDPGNVTADDAGYASVTLLPGESSQWLDCTQFGFAIPGAAAITSIKVEVKAKTLSGAAVDDVASLYLLTAGVTGEYGDDLGTGAVSVTTSEAYLPGGGGYGGDPDATWNVDGISPGIVMESVFGFRWAARNDHPTDTVTVRVNHIRMTVEWE